MSDIDFYYFNLDLQTLLQSSITTFLIKREVGYSQS
jgi:hypothetical protein